MRSARSVPRLPAATDTTPLAVAPLPRADMVSLSPELLVVCPDVLASVHVENAPTVSLTELRVTIVSVSQSRTRTVRSLISRMNASSVPATNGIGSTRVVPLSHVARY